MTADGADPRSEQRVDRTLEDLLELVYREPVELTRDDVVERSGLDLELIRQFWRAMGYADVGDAVAFTESDLDALMTLRDLADKLGLTFDETLDVVRSIGQTTSRLADWQVDTFGRILARQPQGRFRPSAQGSASEPSPVPADEDDAAGAPSQSGSSGAGRAGADPQFVLNRAYDISGEALDSLGELITYAWRRNIGAALQRNIDIAAFTGEGPVDSTVGFADLVGYTRLSRQLPDRQLAALVQHFDASASDAVASTGARLLKTIGDEVMFVGSTPEQAAETAIALHRANPGGDEAPQLRIGLATGPVVARMGDLYGSTVNRAARLTVLAPPGATLVDDATRAGLFRADAAGAESAADEPGGQPDRSSSPAPPDGALADPRFQTAPFTATSLRGLGITVAWSMGPGAGDES